MVSTKVEIANRASTFKSAPKAQDILRVWDGICEYLAANLDKGKVSPHQSFFLDTFPRTDYFSADSPYERPISAIGCYVSGFLLIYFSAS